MQAEPYKQPVQLAAETEAVLARCGEAERLLTRVAPRLERLPPEPPLLLLNNEQQRGKTAAAAAATDSMGRAQAKLRSAARQQPAERGKEEEGEEEDGARERDSDAAAAAGAAGGKAGGKVGGSADSGDGPLERLNVLVVFIDSLGRRHFFRRMPRSAAALEAVARRGHSRLYQVRVRQLPGTATPTPTHRVPHERTRAAPRRALLRTSPAPWPPPPAVLPVPRAGLPHRPK